MRSPYGLAALVAALLTMAVLMAYGIWTEAQVTPTDIQFSGFLQVAGWFYLKDFAK